MPTIGDRPVHTTVARAERWWIEKAREDPYYFIWYITGHQPARHHEMWLSLMFDTEKKRVNIISAREMAKTTITVYALAWMMSKYPLLTFGIIAVSSTIARDRLSMIRHLIGDNLRYRNVFPHIKIDKKKPDTQDEFTIWSDEVPYNNWQAAIVTQQSELVKNPSIFAAGNGGKGVIGRRLSGGFLLDDMVDDTFLSDELQAKMMRYISAVLEPCVTPTGRIWNIGTRWMIEDIYERLAGNPMWHTITIPAIIYDAEHRPHATWPSFWPLERLEEKRLTMDDDILFRIMYLCDPTAITASLFLPKLFDKENPLPQPLPVFKDVYVLFDTATSGKSYADFNVGYICGVDGDRNVFVLDGIRYKEDDGEESAEKMIQLFDAAFLMYEKRPKLYLEIANAEGIFRSLIQNRRPDIKVNAWKPNVDKMTRAKQVSYWGHRNKLFINKDIPFLDQMKSEWMNFPVHKHDDTLDPVSMLFQILNFAKVSAQTLHIKPTATALAMIRKKQGKRLKTGS